MSKTLEDFKKCNKCNELQVKSKFSKRSTAADGLNHTCKACMESYRLAKGNVSKEEALNYQKKLVQSGQLFTCGCCNGDKTADQFYTRRDYGKVQLNLGKCKQCQLDYQLFKSFGVTVEQFNTMLADQDYSCKICKIPEAEYRTQGYRDRFAVDHCHETGAIRGLLCDKCNRGLGFFKDSMPTLKSAISYLS